MQVQVQKHAFREAQRTFHLMDALFHIVSPQLAMSLRDVSRFRYQIICVAQGANYRSVRKNILEFKDFSSCIKLAAGWRSKIKSAGHNWYRRIFCKFGDRLRIKTEKHATAKGYSLAWSPR